MFLPDMFPLLRVIGVAETVMVQDMLHDIFGHAAGQVGIDHAREGQVPGEIRVGEQMVDPRAEGINGPQVPEFRELSMRHFPAKRILDFIRVANIRPDADFKVGDIFV